MKLSLANQNALRSDDVAGLIPGAHKGHGLGNQFLTDLSETDVLVHVTRTQNVLVGSGEPGSPGRRGLLGDGRRRGRTHRGHDPREDVDFLETELDMWYLEVLSTN